eukprot:scaffold174073_cov53-Attheya_sp.AAC.3
MKSTEQTHTTKGPLSGCTDKVASLSPSFLDLMGVHLASRLCRGGAQSLAHSYLNPTDHNNQEKGPATSFRIYWRSKLLLPSLKYESSETDESIRENLINMGENQVIFVDLSIDFKVASTKEGEESHPPHVEMTWGAMVTAAFNNIGAHYARCAPMTKLDIETHAKRLGIDCDETPPHAMAILMAHAMTGHNTLQASASRSLISIQLTYTDLQEEGSLTFPRPIVSTTEQGFSHLDVTTLSMILTNFSHQDIDNDTTKQNIGDTPGENNTEEEEMVAPRVALAFSDWWDRNTVISSHDEYNTLSDEFKKKSADQEPNTSFNSVTPLYNTISNHRRESSKDNELLSPHRSDIDGKKITSIVPVENTDPLTATAVQLQSAAKSVEIINQDNTTNKESNIASLEHIKKTETPSSSSNTISAPTGRKRSQAPSGGRSQVSIVAQTAGGSRRRKRGKITIGKPS